MTAKNKSKKTNGGKKLLGLIFGFIVACLSGAGITVIIQLGSGEETKTLYTLELSTEQIPAEMVNDQGEVIIDENIPTVEEVDGGLFRDKDTGVSLVEGQYADLGWAEWYDTSSPDAFKNATLGRCIIAGNYWGAQCVSLARVFWWSYANRDVSTCGTGMAKGMMNCADENAGSDFQIYWKGDAYRIQAGDWLVFDGGQYGHVGMALGGVVNGYVALLGENQGGRACEGGGAATNIINISIKNLIGFYRPKAYIKVEPKPAPTSTPISESDIIKYEVKKGDTLGQILRNLGYTGNHLFGDDGLAQKVAEENEIANRSLIYPHQVIIIDKRWLTN